MFNKEEYIEFIESNIEWVGTSHNSITKEEFLLGLLQFNEPVYKYINRSQSSVSNCLGKMFKTILINRKSNARVNDYLLYVYGYKYCKHCSQVLSFDYFCSDKSRWDDMSLKCNNCLAGYREDNYKEYYKQYAKNYRKENDDKLKIYGQQYREENKEKEKMRHKKYQKENPHKGAAKTRKYLAAKLNRTPKWLTKQHLIELDDIYWCARESERILGYKHHVDHIIPLQGQNVSGLHVPWNLQILTQTENIRKSNRHESDGGI